MQQTRMVTVPEVVPPYVGNLNNNKYIRNIRIPFARTLRQAPNLSCLRFSQIIRFLTAYFHITTFNVTRLSCFFLFLYFSFLNPPLILFIGYASSTDLLNVTFKIELKKGIYLFNVLHKRLLSFVIKRIILTVKMT